MSRRAATWTSVILLALVLASCGAEADASADASRASRRTTTTTVAPTTTTTVAPPYSFDGSVPPPKLINTGTDYAAIVKSLDDYGHWLYAHNPDRSLVGEVAVVGTQPQQRMDRDMATLSERNFRIYDTASNLIEAEVITARDSAVSLRLHYADDKKVLVDHTGQTVDVQSLPKSTTEFVLLASDSTGRWRLAAVDRQANP
jgi:hypothetical protein